MHAHSAVPTYGARRPIASAKHAATIGSSAENSTSQRSDHSTLSICEPESGTTSVANRSGSDQATAVPCQRSQPSAIAGTPQDERMLRGGQDDRRDGRHVEADEALADEAGRAPWGRQVGAGQHVPAEHEEHEDGLAAGPQQVQRRVGHRPLEARGDLRLGGERVRQPASAQRQVVGDDHRRSDAADAVEPAQAPAGRLRARRAVRRRGDRRARVGHVWMVRAPRRVWSGARVRPGSPGRRSGTGGP